MAKKASLGEQYFSRMTRKETVWRTNGGLFTTRHECPINFTLPEFTMSRDVKWTVQVDESPENNSRYDMIMGRDLLSTLGIDIMWSKGTLVWDNLSIPMKDATETRVTSDVDATAHLLELFEVEDEHISHEYMEATHILDAKYEKADIPAYINAQKHLTRQQKQLLLAVLSRHETLFDGTLGDWNTTPVDFQLKPDAKPYHAKPMPVRSFTGRRSEKRSNECAK